MIESLKIYNKICLMKSQAIKEFHKFMHLMRLSHLKTLNQGAVQTESLPIQMTKIIGVISYPVNCLLIQIKDCFKMRNKNTNNKYKISLFKYQN